MTFYQTTRNGASIGGATLAVLLLAAIWGCGLRPSGVAVDAKLAALTPSQTDAVVGVNLDRLRVSALYQRHAGQWAGAVGNNAVQRLGFDPQRDIQAVLLATAGEHLLVLADGHFRSDALEGKLIASGGKRESVAGVTAVNGAPTPRQAVLFPRDGVAAIVPSDGLTKTAEQMMHSPGGLPEVLRSQLRTLPETAQIWFALEGPVPPWLFKQRTDVRSILTSLSGYITNAVGGVTVDSGLHVRVDLSCDSVVDARQVLGALRGGLAFVRMGLPANQQAMSDGLNAVRVLQEDTTVRVRADIDGALADRLVEGLESGHP